MSLHRKPDLTRWNRAGLRRFRYIDGNAATYLETLRLAMIEAFDDPEKGLKWTELRDALPEGHDEGPRERIDRWLAQYHAGRRDHAWEILRAFARSGHVLGEYIDAYANESYLGTATQWESMRRLVEMIDYHPAAPASAETTVALLVKGSGKVGAGLAAKDKPKDGATPVIFETLADLDVDPALNIIRAPDWNRSQTPLEAANVSGVDFVSFAVDTAPLEISVGERGVLLALRDGQPEVGIAVEVDAIGTDALELRLTGDAAPATWPDATLYSETRLLLQPRIRQAPRIAGSDVLVLEPGHGITPRMRIAWNRSGWKAATVSEVDGDRIRLQGGPMPAVGDDLYAMAESRAQSLDNDGTSEYWTLLPHGDSRKSGTPVFDSGLGTIASGSGAIKDFIADGGVLFNYLLGSHYALIYYVPAADPLGRVAGVAPDGLVLDGKPALEGTEWLLLESAGEIHAAVILSQQAGGDSLQLGTDPSLAGLGGIDLVYGDFAYDLLPSGHDVNEAPVYDTAAQSGSSSTLALDLAAMPELMKPGRRLLIAGDGVACAVTVKSVDRTPGSLSVTVTPGIPLAADGGAGGYTRHATIIYANAVQAGHGETKPERILGGGDATQSNQSFNLDVENISHLRDTAFPSGVRADLRLFVDGREWTQVANLNDSGPEDHHYSVRMREDGTVTLAFGDGEHGRRLPTGSNNLRVVYRVGSGLGGNLDAYGLIKLNKPHVLVKELVQPIAATGGNHMEGIESMRKNAPASVLTLERAVSVSDFAHLAAANSSVWQAHAYALPSRGGRSERIEVVVVPAGGGELNGLGDQIRTTLARHAVPGVIVSVSGYRAVIPSLEVTVAVKREAYQPEVVVDRVREALLTAFALSTGRLGAPLFRSRLFEVVEALEGVENSSCRILDGAFRDFTGALVTPRRVAIGGDGEVRRVSIEPDQVIYLDATVAMPVVTAVDYSL